MDFLRRLLGIRAEDTIVDKDKTNPNAATVKPAELLSVASQEPVITTPDEPLPTGAPAPVIQAPTPDDVDLTPSPTQAAMLSVGTRQLPPLDTIEATPGKPGKHLIYGISTDVGMVRSNNQDALFAFVANQVSSDGQPDFGVFVVADGMGGHHDGEKASALAARLVGRYILDKFYIPLLQHRAENADTPIISEVLNEAVQEANQAVSDEVPEGGTTVTAAAIFGGLVYVGHVGDSRAYIITPDDIEQITRDHSLVQRLIELDQLTPEEAANHPQKNVLYRAVGQSDQLEVDTSTRRLPPGSRLLLCSDGLWNQLDKDAILQTTIMARTPQEACDKLIKLANER
ncbi:MAG TPA: PP2C family serine/threonine-protein phosphatase, partial [Aggregatilineales bacterium]|nr:PP2C family serine/threonine-protein phosphatase [Aggregatilineales bacterium]